MSRMSKKELKAAQAIVAAENSPKVLKTFETMEGIDSRIVMLLEMLRYKRPMKSYSENAFISRFIKPTGALSDECGNYWLEIGENNKILWSSHTDTVHHTPGLQKIYYGDGYASTDSGECLGADCTTGVWLMIQMIRANIPGVYVFHHGEERGGIGSRYIAKESPERLFGIQFAIAFDRKGQTDVITHQGGSRSCSDAFAKSLATILGKLFAQSNEGIFTDTANYTDLIGECTNISVGYEKAHTPKEYQDCYYVLTLLETILSADFSSLVSERKPGEYDESDFDYYYGFGGKYSNSNSIYPVTTKTVIGRVESDYKQTWSRWDSFLPQQDMLNFVSDNPAIVASFLEECGYDMTDLKRFAKDYE